jgi:hypothetical protein
MITYNYVGSIVTGTITFYEEGGVTGQFTSTPESGVAASFSAGSASGTPQHWELNSGFTGCTVTGFIFTPPPSPTSFLCAFQSYNGMDRIGQSTLGGVTHPITIFGSGHLVAVPGPIAGSGLLGLVLAAGLLAWHLKRRAAIAGSLSSIPNCPAPHQCGTIVGAIV